MSGPPPTTSSQLTRQTSRSSTSANKLRHHHHHHPHLHRHHNKREAGQSESALALASSTGVNDIHIPAWALGSKEHIYGGSGEEGKKEKEQEISLRDWDKGRAKKKEVTWEEVDRAREKRKECEETLHSSLTDLSTLAHTTTRRLDYTYYNLLSSFPLIRQTISSLSSLSEITTSLHTNFTTSSIPSLVASTNDQITTLSSSFEDDAAEKIKRLEERMKEARERVEKLGERVEGVRGRVEGWEKRSKMRGGRGRWGWGCLVTLFAISLVVGLGRHGGEVERVETWTGDEKVMTEIEDNRFQDLGNETVEWTGAEEILKKGRVGREDGNVAEAGRPEVEKQEMNTRSPFNGDENRDQNQDQDPRLRIFDKL